MDQWLRQFNTTYSCQAGAWAGRGQEVLLADALSVLHYNQPLELATAAVMVEIAVAGDNRVPDSPHRHLATSLQLADGPT